MQKYSTYQLRMPFVVVVVVVVLIFLNRDIPSATAGLNREPKNNTCKKSQKKYYNNNAHELKMDKQATSIQKTSNTEF
jgi:hypothetical protein